MPQLNRYSALLTGLPQRHRLPYLPRREWHAFLLKLGRAIMTEITVSFETCSVGMANSTPLGRSGGRGIVGRIAVPGISPSRICRYGVLCLGVAYLADALGICACPLSTKLFDASPVLLYNWTALAPLLGRCDCVSYGHDILRIVRRMAFCAEDGPVAIIGVCRLAGMARYAMAIDAELIRPFP